eukprot:CAMPEP_0184497310 /NCGR_PEP_ID=MMETSP0113_2-20130426/36140_1 /TAXON_ID=91329 /ORGANISM="Norrisiella sphaerica, Strain BC52" /LENGTH=819 /DNA_ID=CAMNT_0026884343 /DNA_START=297 /DNA_END=2753 /DNA_ORIENTATION=+
MRRRPRRARRRQRPAKDPETPHNIVLPCYPNEEGEKRQSLKPTGPPTIEIVERLCLQTINERELKDLSKRLKILVREKAVENGLTTESSSSNAAAPPHSKRHIGGDPGQHRDLSNDVPPLEEEEPRRLRQNSPPRENRDTVKLGQVEQSLMGVTEGFVTEGADPSKFKQTVIEEKPRQKAAKYAFEQLDARASTMTLPHSIRGSAKSEAPHELHSFSASSENERSCDKAYGQGRRDTNGRKRTIDEYLSKEGKVAKDCNNAKGGTSKVIGIDMKLGEEKKSTVGMMERQAGGQRTAGNQTQRPGVPGQSKSTAPPSLAPIHTNSNGGFGRIFREEDRGRKTGELGGKELPSSQPHSPLSSLRSNSKSGERPGDTHASARRSDHSSSLERIESLDLFKILGLDGGTQEGNEIGAAEPGSYPAPQQKDALCYIKRETRKLEIDSTREMEGLSTGVMGVSSVSPSDPIKQSPSKRQVSNQSRDSSETESESEYSQESAVGEERAGEEEEAEKHILQVLDPGRRNPCNQHAGLEAVAIKKKDSPHTATFHDIPEIVLMGLIMAYLSPADFLRMSVTCRSLWNRARKRGQVAWKLFYERQCEGGREKPEGMLLLDAKTQVIAHAVSEHLKVALSKNETTVSVRYPVENNKAPVLVKAAFLRHRARNEFFHEIKLDDIVISKVTRVGPRVADVRVKIRKKQKVLLIHQEVDVALQLANATAKLRKIQSELFLLKNLIRERAKGEPATYRCIYGVIHVGVNLPARETTSFSLNFDRWSSLSVKDRSALMRAGIVQIPKHKARVRVGKSLRSTGVHVDLAAEGRPVW